MATNYPKPVTTPPTEDELLEDLKAAVMDEQGELRDQLQPGV